MPHSILLKLKYRNPNKKLQRRAGIDPPEGTWTYSGDRFKAVTSNAGTKAKRSTAGNGHRRRAYGPWFNKGG